MPFKDPKRKLQYSRELYHKQRTLAVQRVSKRKKKLKGWLDNYKQTLKCSLCGENHPATIDFHHKYGKEKDVTISYLIGNGYSIERVKQELEKCQILCSNCHRKIHYKTAIFKRA
jgi:transcription elongation factor Elf1